MSARDTRAAALGRASSDSSASERRVDNMSGVLSVGRARRQRAEEVASRGGVVRDV